MYFRAIPTGQTTREQRENGGNMRSEQKAAGPFATAEGEQGGLIRVGGRGEDMQ